MEKDTLVLKDGTVMELETGASLGDVRVLFPDKAAFFAGWDRLSEDNLSEVQVKNGAGLAVGRYKGLLLVNETSSVQADGTVLTSFCFREKDAMEKRMDAIEAGQGVQDAALGEMAEELTNTQMALTEAYEMMGNAE